MIVKGLRNFVRLGVSQNRFAFSDHEEPAPTKLGKVKDTLYSFNLFRIHIYVRNKFGVVETVPARVGESLL